jgi:peroxiredoxin Q/BCP
VVFFGASVDTPEENKKFAEHLELTYPLLSDPGKEVAKAYGVVGGDRQRAARWTFYISPEGKILHVDRDVSPATAGSAVAERLASLGVPRAK